MKILKWRLMQDSDDSYNCPIWCSKTVPWKWIVLYRYPKAKHHFGWQYTQNNSEKCVHWTFGRHGYTLSIRLYRGREAAYRSRHFIYPKVRR